MGGVIEALTQHVVHCMLVFCRERASRRTVHAELGVAVAREDGRVAKHAAKRVAHVECEEKSSIGLDSS